MNRGKISILKSIEFLVCVLYKPKICSGTAKRGAKIDSLLHFEHVNKNSVCIRKRSTSHDVCIHGGCINIFRKYFDLIVNFPFLW